MPKSITIISFSFLRSKYKSEKSKNQNIFLDNKGCYNLQFINKEIAFLEKHTQMNKLLFVRNKGVSSSS
jgi:hypothetical protein